MWLQSQTGHIRPSADRRPTELSQTSSVWNNTQLNVQFPPQCLKRQPTRPTVPQSVCSRAGMRRGVRWQVSSFRSRCSAPAAAQPLTCSLNNDVNICLKWFMVASIITLFYNMQNISCFHQSLWHMDIMNNPRLHTHIGIIVYLQLDPVNSSQWVWRRPPTNSWRGGKLHAALLSWTNDIYCNLLSFTCHIISDNICRIPALTFI